MTKHGLLPLSQEALFFYKKHSYHKFEGSATDLGERDRLAAALGDTNKIVLLENHGPVCGGGSLAEAFLYMLSITRACEYQVKALSTVGGDLSKIHMPEQSMLDEMSNRVTFDAPEKKAYNEPQLLWDANVRRVEQIYGKDKIYC